MKVRAAQSRVFDTTDKMKMLAVVISTFQNLGFQVEVLDEMLGIVSGKRYVDVEASGFGVDPFYFLYDEEALLVFSRVYRSWGPFEKRSDLVRFTVTVRERNDRQLIVRAAAQFALQPIEKPEPYRRFFAALEQSLFVERQADPAAGG